MYAVSVRYAWVRSALSSDFCIRASTLLFRPRQDASKAGAAERQQSRASSSRKAYGSESSAGGDGERVVFLTTPCTTLEAFVETKVRHERNSHKCSVF